MSDYTGGDDGYTPLMGASRSPYDVNSTPRHEVLNYEGTPTQFSDDSGLKALLTRDGIFDVNSFNPIVKEGEKITADTPRQATNEEGQLLFVDSNGEPTTRPTGTPMVGGTVGDAAYMKEPRNSGGAFGSILSDFKSLPKDELFKKWLLSVAAIGTGGLAAGALGAAAPVAEAFPVLGGGALGGTELGAAALGLTDAQAAALMGEYAPGALGGYGAAGATGLTAAEALKYANLAKTGLGVVSALGGATGGGGTTGGGQGGQTTAVSQNGAWNTFLNPTQIKQDIVAQKPIMQNPQLASIYKDLDPYLNNQLAQAGMTPSNLGGGQMPVNFGANQQPSANYFTYGSSSPMQMANYGQQLINGAPLTAKKGGAIHKAKGGRMQDSEFAKTAMGGNYGALTAQAMKLLNPSFDIGQLAGFKDGGQEHIPEFITGATGHYVKGRGDGQSDDIPAMLADGEYVFDSETVAQLGNGSSDAGAKVLDKMRESIRAHKRSADVDEIPPKSKSPLEYIKEGMKRK